MKNEMDETATKHKNEDFLAKLDKDRRDKGCEYAVLVSLLEPDNDFIMRELLMCPTAILKCLWFVPSSSCL